MPRLDTIDSPEKLKAVYSKQQEMIRKDAKIAAKRRKKLEKRELERQKLIKDEYQHDPHSHDVERQQQSLLYGGSYFIGTTGIIKPVGNDEMSSLSIGVNNNNNNTKPHINNNQQQFQQPPTQQQHVAVAPNDIVNTHSSKPNMEMDYLTSSIDDIDESEYEPINHNTHKIVSPPTTSSLFSSPSGLEEISDNDGQLRQKKSKKSKNKKGKGKGKRKKQQQQQQEDGINNEVVGDNVPPTE